MVVMVTVIRTLDMGVMVIAIRILVTVTAIQTPVMVVMGILPITQAIMVIHRLLRTAITVIIVHLIAMVVMVQVTMENDIMKSTLNIF